MKTVECPNCGESVPLFARACGYCGAPNRARLTAIIASTAAAVGHPSGYRRRPRGLHVGASRRRRGGLAFGRSIAGDRRRFRLAGEGDEGLRQAGREGTDTLHFLVTPLVDEPRDDRGWRRISLNEIGNAILINGEDTIAGLKRRKALRLSTDAICVQRPRRSDQGGLPVESVGGREAILVNEGAPHRVSSGCSSNRATPAAPPIGAPPSRASRAIATGLMQSCATRGGRQIAARLRRPDISRIDGPAAETAGVRYGKIEKN